MIYWSIKACIEAINIHRVIVSTDDPEIKSCAESLGAEVPFMRPECLANDKASTMAPMQHAAKWLTDSGIAVNALCCVYATAPLMQAQYIDQAYGIFNCSNLDYVFSATTYAYPIQRSLILSKTGHVSMREPATYHKRSQDLQETWHDAGQFYWGSVSAWSDARPIFLSKSKIVQIPRMMVQDIDTHEDWDVAEQLFALAHPKTF